ncbi:MAG: uracil-DNA glycosylase [Candidatus Woesebacteria bacterium]|nr:uracil-DNA glycosylase [Candidatus Woesebacteria bacterium]
MDKKEELDKLKSGMEKDGNLPLKTFETNLVFGVGNPDAEILFVGEGPGFHENRLKEPFVGNAGMLLNRLLASINIPREEVYITNVVHHRPPENRDPLPEEISAYGKYLDEIIEIINPKVIVTLGRFSMAKFLPNARISGVHGKKFEVNWNGKNILVVPMYHPAAALRNGAVMEQIKNDFLKLPDYLKKEVNEESKIKIEQSELF